jgi:hypothetical protein
VRLQKKVLPSKKRLQQSLGYRVTRKDDTEEEGQTKRKTKKVGNENRSLKQEHHFFILNPEDFGDKQDSRSERESLTGKNGHHHHSLCNVIIIEGTSKKKPETSFKVLHNSSLNNFFQ